MWRIGVIVIFGLFILYIIYDQRKKIFKKRKKKEKIKKQISTESKEKPKSVEKKELKVSFEEKSLSSVKPVIEEIENPSNEDEKNEEVFEDFPREKIRQMKNFFPKNSRVYKDENLSKSASIKKQIKDLSPEMKAILFADILNRKED